MSTEPFEPFFLEIPSEFFHSSSELYAYRDNLRVEVASDESSFMTKGPKLLLAGMHVRISNRTKPNRGSLSVIIRIDPHLRLFCDQPRLDNDFVAVCKKLGDDASYSPNQVCCTTALQEIFEREGMAIRFSHKLNRLILVVNEYENPHVDLCSMQVQWLNMQKPASNTVTKSKARR